MLFALALNKKESKRGEKYGQEIYFSLVKRNANFF
jgi:hypothetical protein